MKPLFLQAASKNPHFQGMIDDHRARHQAYCDKWGYEFMVDDSLLGKPDPFHWTYFMELIQKHVESGQYSHVYWMDADIFIANLDVDMRQTLPEWAFLAATLHPFPWTPLQPVVTINAGVMYWNCSQMAKAFLARLMSMKNEIQDNQVGMNWLLMGGPESSFWQKGFRVLNCEWNNNQHDQPCRPIVAAFHGCLEPQYRRVLMQNVAKRYPFE